MNRDRYLTLDKIISFSNSEMVSSLLFRSPGGKLAVYSSASPENEQLNQDKISIIPVDDQSMVLVIADGAGGYAHGGQASSVVITKITNALEKAISTKNSLREAILIGIETANRTIIEDIKGGASTVAVVEIQGRMIRTYHVGDTEVLITGLRGKVKHSTISHSPVAYAVEAGFLDESDAVMHKERHFVSNILGFEDMHISISTPTCLSSYDTLIVGTDGLFDNLHKDEIVQLIRKGALKLSSQKLISLANERMLGENSKQPSKSDDMSFILYRNGVVRT